MTIPLATLQTLLQARSFHLADESDMQQLGAELAQALPAGSFITLSGELGAGKSVLVRSIIHSLGYVGRIKSPTYTLIELYDVSSNDGHIRQIAHLDLYRLSDAEELDYLGFDDLLNTCDLMLIEWPEMGEGRLPPATLHIQIDYTDNAGRSLILSAPSQQSG